MSKKQVIELEWFSVDEVLPDTNNTIFMRTMDDEILVGELIYGTHFCADDYHKDNISVTHWCYYPDFGDFLFSYAQDISVDLDPSCEVDDDGSVILTEDELTNLINEVDNV